MFTSKDKATVKLLKQQTTTTRAMLSNMTTRTLGTGNMKAAVLLPEGEDLDDWFAANLVDFFNEISLLYGLVSENAQEKYTKAGEGFPLGFEYRWTDAPGNAARRVSAPEYVDYVLSWVEAQIDDPSIFPVDESHPFPRDFRVSYCKDIYKRLFRVFGIIYHRHFEKIQELDAAAHLNTCFKHFMYFSIAFNMLEEQEIQVMKAHVEKFRAEFAYEDAPYHVVVTPAKALISKPRVVESSTPEATVKPVDESISTPQAPTRFFLSHHKRDAAGECLFLHHALCSSLGIKESEGFLDSNDLKDLTLLLQHVQSTLVLVLIQTAEVLHRPWVLLELYTAIKEEIPIVCVLLEGKGYDHLKAKEMLSSKEAFEAALGESSLADLQKHGGSPETIREELERVLPSRISFKFDSAAPAETRNGMIRDISKEIMRHSAGYATMITKPTPLERVRPMSPNDRKFLGHTDTIYAIACSPNSRMVATGSADKTIRLWDITGRAKCEVLIGHTAEVTSLAFFPLSAVEVMLASGSKDNSVRVWNTTTRTVVKVLTTENAVGSVAFSSDGQCLACGSSSTLRFWQKSNWSVRKSIRQAHEASIDAICFSPNSKLVITGGKDNMIKVWGVDTFQLIRTLPGHSKSVSSLAFASNSKLFASASNDYSIVVWDSVTLSQITRLTFPDSCGGVVFSPDSKMLTIACADKTVRSAVARDGETYKEDVVLTRHARLVRCVAFTPDSQYVVSGGADKVVSVLNLMGD